LPQPASNAQYNLDQVADLAGVNPRTVRYYIQLGLIDRPIGETRAAHYTWQHLKQLLEVRGYTEQGFSLERIGELMRRDEEAPLRRTCRDRAASPSRATFVSPRELNWSSSPDSATDTRTAAPLRARSHRHAQSHHQGSGIGN
jgi:DNA-binding transcriptional MerR regulator